MSRMWVLVWLLAGCGNTSTEGEIGGHCYPNGTCNVTLTCSGGTCVALTIDAGVDAHVDATVDARTDAHPDASPCADDSAYEPNGTIATAYQTEVATQLSTVTYTGLSICPSTDKDIYAVDITVAGQNLEAIATYAVGPPLSVDILNTGGSIIGVSMTDGAMMVRAYVASLPVGRFYAQVAGGNGENNYQLKLTVTGP